MNHQGRINTLFSTSPGTTQIRKKCFCYRKLLKNLLSPLRLLSMLSAQMEANPGNFSPTLNFSPVHPPRPISISSLSVYSLFLPATTPTPKSSLLWIDKNLPVVDSRIKCQGKLKCIVISIL